MIRAKVAYLIAEDPKAHGIFDAPAETMRQVFCTERSVGQTEVYQAKAQGLNPELKLILPHAFDYKGEKKVSYQGERYDILRTYRDGDSMELTIQREERNAAPAEVSGNV